MLLGNYTFTKITDLADGGSISFVWTDLDIRATVSEALQADYFQTLHVDKWTKATFVHKSVGSRIQFDLIDANRLESDWDDIRAYFGKECGEFLRQRHHDARTIVIRYT